MVIQKNEFNNLNICNNSMANNFQHQPIVIRLEDRELWMRFFGKTNEMIVTRSGR